MKERKTKSNARDTMAEKGSRRTLSRQPVQYSTDKLQHGMGGGLGIVLHSATCGALSSISTNWSDSFFVSKELPAPEVLRRWHSSQKTSICRTGKILAGLVDFYTACAEPLELS